MGAVSISGTQRERSDFAPGVHTQKQEIQVGISNLKELLESVVHGMYMLFFILTVSFCHPFSLILTLSISLSYTRTHTDKL